MIKKHLPQKSILNILNQIIGVALVIKVRNISIV